MEAVAKIDYIEESFNLNVYLVALYRCLPLPLAHFTSDVVTVLSCR